MPPQPHPSALRNAPHLVEALRGVLPSHGLVLEIASGGGYHAVAFADAFPNLVWQPSEPNAEAREGIAAYRAETKLQNLCAPLALDVMDMPWPITKADAVICLNMIHISPWAATLALFSSAANILGARALLFTYGPYILHGDFLAESNITFDQSLKSRNPAWGLREVDDVAQVAVEAGFKLDKIIPMPASNLSLVWLKDL
ncbi:MAG: DUF938 domain-containing protein [Rhodospirillaceae bacterium]|nr:DUF938 domain-containing protein [Rhodospirillaceae bacterium]